MLYVAAVSATRDGAEWIRSECEKYHIALSYCECVAEEELDGVLSELEKEADLLICDAEFCEGRNIKLPVLRIDTAGDEERFLSEVVARMLDRVEALQKQDARMQALRRCHFNGVIEIDEKRRILAISKVATKLLNCWGKMLKGEDLLNVISTLGEDVVDTVLRDGQRVFTLITAPDKSIATSRHSLPESGGLISQCRPKFESGINLIPWLCSQDISACLACHLPLN